MLVAGVTAVGDVVGGRHAPAAERIVTSAVLQVPLVVADNGHAAQVVAVDVEQAVVGAVGVVNDASGHGCTVQQEGPTLDGISRADLSLVFWGGSIDTEDICSILAPRTSETITFATSHIDSDPSSGKFSIESFMLQ